MENEQDYQCLVNDDLIKKPSDSYNSLLEYIDEKDKEYSDKLFNYKGNKFIEVMLYVFARLFNPDLVTIYFIILTIYLWYMELSYAIIIKFFTHVLVAVIITVILKKVFGRERPSIDNTHLRFVNLRKEESNCSMPSGDSMQSANFSIILFCYCNTSLGFIVIPFVMTARIYYHCHYILDTVIGSLLGLIVSYGTYMSINKMIQ